MSNDIRNDDIKMFQYYLQYYYHTLHIIINGVGTLYVYT